VEDGGDEGQEEDEEEEEAKAGARGRGGSGRGRWAGRREQVSRGERAYGLAEGRRG